MSEGGGQDYSLSSGRESFQNIKTFIAETNLSPHEVSRTVTKVESYITSHLKA